MTIRRLARICKCHNTSAFNQPLGSWNISGVGRFGNMRYMFDGSGLSANSYDARLIGWSQRSDVPSGVHFGARGIQYSASAVQARGVLTGSPHNWNITEGGQES